MSERIPEISGGSIVLAGSFNPAIFQPAWFGRQGLLAGTEVDNAEIKIVHPQISFFETERFVVQVTANRFAAISKPNASAEPLRDLVAGTFFILEHTTSYCPWPKSSNALSVGIGERLAWARRQIGPKRRMEQCASRSTGNENTGNFDA
jgi:hypothetical protein